MNNIQFILKGNLTHRISRRTTNAIYEECQKYFKKNIQITTKKAEVFVKIVAYMNEEEGFALIEEIKQGIISSRLLPKLPLNKNISVLQQLPRKGSVPKVYIVISWEVRI